MITYWFERRRQALESSRSAESAELRELYLGVAEHCRSLAEWCSSPARSTVQPRRASGHTFVPAKTDTCSTGR